MKLIFLSQTFQLKYDQIKSKNLVSKNKYLIHFIFWIANLRALIPI